MGDRDSNAGLIAGIARRERVACTAFYRRHLPVVLAFLLRETQHRELAADLTAEVFGRLVAAPRYRVEHPSAAPWVLGIARNTLGTSRRRGRVEDRVRTSSWDIAAELRCSDMVVRKRVSRGLTRLRRQLERR